MKKLNLTIGADLIKRGDIKSKVVTKIQQIYSSYFKDSDDYILTPEREKLLTKEVELKTRKGKVIKKEMQIVFDDIEEEVKYR